MKPIIGLIPLWDDDKQSLWMLPGYADALTQAGAIPVTLPLTTSNEDLQQIAARIDGLLLTGGQDVSPCYYGEAPLPQCGTPCPARDRMELALIPLMLQQHKPILGICRGIQLLNVALGGTLYQDLDLQHPSMVQHHMQPPYDRAIHPVSILPGTHLHRILASTVRGATEKSPTEKSPTENGVIELGVNSYHHQAVRQLAPSLRASALSPDGLVEAVELPTEPFVIAVQWHPEFRYLTDAPSQALFRAFVAACHPLQ